MVALTIGVSTVLGISLKEFIVDGHVSVGIDNHAHVQLEVPSVQVCPYSSEVSILSGPASPGNPHHFDSIEGTRSGVSDSESFGARTCASDIWKTRTIVPDTLWLPSSI